MKKSFTILNSLLLSILLSILFIPTPTVAQLQEMSNSERIHQIELKISQLESQIAALPCKVQNLPSGSIPKEQKMKTQIELIKEDEQIIKSIMSLPD